MKTYKKILGVFLALLIFSLAMVGSASAISGSGTSSDPYLISSSNDLLYLNTYPSAYFELAQDIDCSGFNNVNICNNTFTGSFDGKGHVIHSWSPNYQGASEYSLFGNVSPIYFGNFTLSTCSILLNDAHPAGALLFTNIYSNNSSSGINIKDINIINSAVHIQGTNTSSNSAFFTLHLNCMNGGNVVFENIQIAENYCSTLATSRFSNFTAFAYSVTANSVNTSLTLTNVDIFSNSIHASCVCGYLNGLYSNKFTNILIQDCDFSSNYIASPFEDSANRFSGLIVLGQNVSCPLTFKNVQIFNNQIGSSNGTFKYNTLMIEFPAGGSLVYNAILTAEDCAISHNSIFTTFENSMSNLVIYNHIGHFLTIPEFTNFVLTYNNVQGESEGSSASMFGDNSFVVNQSNSIIEYNNLRVTSNLYTKNCEDSTTITRVSTAPLSIYPISLYSYAESQTDLKNKGFIAYFAGASLDLTGDSAHGWYPYYEWDYDYDTTFTTDASTYTPNSTHIYSSSGEYSVAVKLFSASNRSTQIMTTTVNTDFLGAPEISDINATNWIVSYGTSTTLTVACPSGYGASTYKFERSTDGGNTWTTLQNTSSSSLTTSLPSGSGTTVMDIKVTATNSYGSAIGRTQVIVTNGITEVEVTPISISSEEDAYNINYQIQTPFEVKQTIALGNTSYGLIVTKYEIELIDTKPSSASQCYISSFRNYSAEILDAKYSNGYLIIRDALNRVYLTQVMTDGFTLPIEITGFSGNVVNDVDVSKFGILVSSTNGNNNFGTAFDFEGNLKYEVIGTVGLNAFTLAKSTTDGSDRIVIICANNENINTKFIRAYTNSNSFTQVAIQTSNDITGIVAEEGYTKLITKSYNGRSFLIPFSITTSNVTISSPLQAEDIRFSKIDATDYDMRFVGISNSNTYYIMNSTTGATAYTYNVTSAPQTIKISSLNGAYVIGGDASGRVTILGLGSSGWNYLMTYSMNSGSIVDVDVSAMGLTVMSSSTYYTYIGYNQQTQPSEEQILTTKYYLKVYLYDDKGKIMKNTSVTLVGSSGVKTEVTDDNGTVTFEVVPTESYTILANDLSVTYVADNVALQYLTMGGKVDKSNDIKYSCTIDDNKKIHFTFTGENAYTGTFKITDKSGNVLQNYNLTHETSLNIVYNTTTQSNITTFVCVLDINRDSDNTNFKKSWTFTIEKRDSHGILMLGSLPIIPAELKDSPVWNILIIGLIMIVGALFGYNSSVRGCIAIVGFTVLLRIFEFIMIPIPMLVFIVIVGFLVVFATSSQNDGN